MELTVNRLFQWCDERARIERTLWIEHDGQCLVKIDVADKKAWPTFIPRLFLEHQIASGVIRLLDSDSDMYGTCTSQTMRFPILILNGEIRRGR